MDGITLTEESIQQYITMMQQAVDVAKFILAALLAVIGFMFILIYNQNGVMRKIQGILDGNLGMCDLKHMGVNEKFENHEQRITHNERNINLLKRSKNGTNS